MLPMMKARYRARAKSWALGAAGTGMPQVGVEFEVDDGDHKGERISGYFALSDAAAEYTLEKLVNCGWTGTDLAELNDPAASATMGANVVELVVEPEDQVKNGQPVIDKETREVKCRLRIQFVNRAGGLAMKNALVGADAQSLSAKMKGKLAAIRAKAKRDGGSASSAPVGDPRPTPPAPAEDDIPF